MTVRLAPKLPSEKRNYRHDWSAFLGSDTIATQSVTSPDVTITGAAIDTDGVVFEAAAGTLGDTAAITMTITTSAGLTESETFLLPIAGDDVLSLAEVKDYLRVRHTDEDAKIAAMIPRARLWVEDHTGLALLQREFVERLLPVNGVVRLSKAPLVSVTSVDYLDSSGAAATLVPRTYPPATAIFTADGWPGLAENEKFAVTYTAGFDLASIDDRLLGAMHALIEGEYAEGYAYPDRAIAAATRCCAYLRAMVA